MMDKVCEVCQEYLATHTITIFYHDHQQDHYLCDDHYDQVDNPKRFLSLLDYPLEQEDTLLKEFYAD